METYIGYDGDSGDMIAKERPIDEYYTWYWQPPVWFLYDDLHKNIKDPKKYEGVNLSQVQEVLVKNPHLIRVCKKKEQFSFLLDTMDSERINNLLLESPVIDVQDRYEEEINIDEWDDPLEIDIRKD